MTEPEIGNSPTVYPWTAEASVSAGTVADGSTKAAFSTPLRVPTGHAREVVAYVESDVAVTAFLRFHAAEGQVQVDTAGTAVAGGASGRVQDTAGLGDEAELLISNASGETATLTAKLYARS